MRKVRIDSNFLGVFSTGLVSLPALFRRVPEIRNSTLESHEFRNHHFRFEKKTVKAVDITGRRGIKISKRMDNDSEFPDLFSNGNPERRLSTFDDVQVALSLLREIIEYEKKDVSSWIIESNLKKLCNFYKSFQKDHKYEFISVLAREYTISHRQVFLSAQTLAKHSHVSEDDAKSDAKIMKNEDQLRSLLTPQYSWLFLHIGRLEKGVKFLVDLRTDVLDLIAEINAKGQSAVEVQRLNITLRELLSLWFSIGFLRLERITWSSSCEMLQKISEYEAVHPVRSWTDLKSRVGPYRRCFIYLHGSMPGEPIVVLHTALSDEIPLSMKGIVSARSRMAVDKAFKKVFVSPQEEDPKFVKVAVFYSISSTQRGLQGIELGNYLIKSVVHELQNEFPQMRKFSSLSPIPNFKSWLLEKLKASEKGPNEALLQEELRSLKAHLNTSDFWRDLRNLLHSNSWIENEELTSMLEKPLMRLCARYLYIEKRRGYALNSVANFHLRNGAVMWRLNWLADTSPRGLDNSCTIMVNYRYFLEDTEFNSRNYLEKQIISASEEIENLAEQAKQVTDVPKM